MGKGETLGERENKNAFSTYYVMLFTSYFNYYNILLFRGYFHWINKGIEIQGFHLSCSRHHKL